MIFEGARQRRSREEVRPFGQESNDRQVGTACFFGVSEELQIDADLIEKDVLHRFKRSVKDGNTSVVHR